MDADAQRRPRWVARMRWWLLLAMAVTAVAFRCWPRWLRRVERDFASLSRALAQAPVVTGFGRASAASDHDIGHCLRGCRLWRALDGRPHGVRGSSRLSCGCFAYSWVGVVRPDMKEAQFGVAVLGAMPAYALSVRWPTLVSSLIWIAGVAHLLWRAVRRNRENYNALVASLANSVASRAK